MLKELLYTLFFLVIILSCNDDKGNNIPSVSVEDIDTEVRDFRPYTRDLDQWDDAMRDHPVVSEIFFGHILGVPPDDTAAIKEAFKNYLEIEATQNISRLIDSTYPDLDWIKSQWELNMAYFHHYFPEQEVHELYVMQTNLGIANFLFENAEGVDAVGVSLGFFLGSAFPYLKLAREKPVFSAYNSRTFNKDHLISKSVNAIVDNMVGPPLEGNMLNAMIREGKRLYILEKVCAEVHDSAVFELSLDGLEWCRNNEWEMWNFFIEKEMLYTTDVKEYAKYLRPAPNSPGMPSSAPGKTGAYVGFRIVEAFMDHHPAITLSEMAVMSAEEIYREARYKPQLK